MRNISNRVYGAIGTEAYKRGARSCFWVCNDAAASISREGIILESQKSLTWGLDRQAAAHRVSIPSAALGSPVR